MANHASNDETIDNPPKDEAPIEVLRRLTKTVRLLRSTDGRFYAQVQAGGRPEIYLLKSAAFRDWLIDGYLRTGREIPSDWLIRRVLRALEATARFESGRTSIFIRVGHDGDSDGTGLPWYLDLADPAGQAVQIGPEGWSIVNNPPVCFRRPDGHLPLPTPGRDGSIELLRTYVNLTEPEFRLLVGWLAAAIRPVGPYPILMLYGETGTAKSTLAEIVRLLIDPQDTRRLAEPQNTRDLMVTAANGWLLSYDNVDALPGWMSACLCRLATGGSFAARASFTESERSVIHAQRPLILNGTDEFVRRGDLSDHSIFFNLEPIASGRRRLDARFWAEFKQDYPRILGGLLDAVAGGLRELPSVRLTESPRMADFAAFAEAVGRALGWPAGTVLSDYNDNRREATLTHLEDSPLADILIELAPQKVDWIRTASDLLAELTAHVGRREAASPRWPKSPLSLSIELRRIAPQMRMHDVSIVFHRTRDKRFISITSTKPPITEASPYLSGSGIESSADELTVGQKSVTDVTPMAATP